MARYIMLNDFQYGTTLYRAGTVLSDSNDPITGMLSDSAPLVLATPEMEARATAYAQSQPLFPAILSLLGGISQPLQAAADGSVGVYIDPVNGNDANDGTVSRPFRTGQRGLDRAASWLELNLTNDIVVNWLAGAHTPENLILNVPRPPKGRIILSGPTAKTVVHTGIATVGTNNYGIVDTAAPFVAGALRGFELHTYDPLNRAATERWITIKDNTTTLVEPPEPFDNVGAPKAAPGWVYEVLTPSAILASPAAGRSVALDIIMPWASEFVPSVRHNLLKSCVILRDLEINNDVVGDNPCSVRSQGGMLGIFGCLFRGVQGGLYVKGGAVASGGDVGVVADPVLGALTLVSFATKCFASKPTGAGGFGMRLAGASVFAESYVSTALGQAINADRKSTLSIFSGHFYTGVVVLTGDSQSPVFGGPAVLPLQFSGQGAAVPALQCFQGGKIPNMGNVLFAAALGGGSAAPAGGCMRVNNDGSAIRLPGTVDGAADAAGTAFVRSVGSLLTAVDAQNKASVQAGKETGRTMIIGRGGTYPTGFLGGETLIINKDGAGDVTVTFLITDTTLALVVTRVNAALAGTAFATAGELQLRSALFGAAGSLAIGAASTALAILGLVAGAVTNGLVGTGATPEVRTDGAAGLWSTVAVAATPLVGATTDARVFRQLNFA